MASAKSAYTVSIQFFFATSWFSFLFSLLSRLTWSHVSRASFEVTYIYMLLIPWRSWWFHYRSSNSRGSSVLVYLLFIYNYYTGNHLPLTTSSTKWTLFLTSLASCMNRPNDETTINWMQTYMIVWHFWKHVYIIITFW